MFQLPLGRRVVWGLFVLTFTVGLYYLASTLAGSRNLSLITDLDRMIPFVPMAVWIYSSYLIVLLGMIFLIEEGIAFQRVSAAVVVTVLLSVVTYYFFPSSYPRPTVECLNASTCMINWMYWIDPSNNTFPSLHVSLSFVVSFCIYDYWQKSIGSILKVWAVAVSISTLLVKQHYILDVFSGILLAFFVRWLIRKWHWFVETA